MFYKRCMQGLLLLLCSAFILSACTQQSSDNSNEETVVEQTIDDLSLTDSSSIYADDAEDSIVTMYLTVRQGNSSDNTNHTWDEVNAHSIYYYEEQEIDRYRVEGILQVGDENGPVSGMLGYGEFEPNCSVQIRGKTSTRSPQKSYKINIQKNEGFWREQRTINLNKHVYDSVRFRNKLSYDLLKTIPNAFSCRTQFVHLYVKDQTEGTNGAEFKDYGLFTQTEQINTTYLRNHGLDENGQLYKANMFEFFRYADAIKLKTDTEYDQSAFEEVLEIKGNDDHTKLIAMLDDLNNYSIPIETTFEEYFDAENYFTWLAFQLLTGNTDTNTQNFFLYSPQNGNKWYFLPWDNDGAWGFEEEIMYDNATSGYNYMRGVSNYWGNLLHQRVLKSEKYRKMLDDKMSDLLLIVTRERVQTMVEQYSAITRTYLARLPDSMYAPEVMPDFEKIIATIPNEMEHTYNMYKVSLESPMPFFIGLPSQNGSKTSFNWDPSYDFDNEKVTYKFELARDYQFNEIVNVQDGLEIPQVFTDILLPGQYFVRITAANESGMTQTAMEVYRDADDVKHYGIAGFYVNADGSVYFS